MPDDGQSTLPHGLVTFLFTDVAGSTRLWEDAPDAMAAAMVEHDQLIEEVIAGHGGDLVRPRGEGDSRFAVFARPSDSIRAAVDIQLRMIEHPWSTPRPVSVRIAVHTGEADLRDGDYYGRAVNRAARLRAAGHPGQVLVSGETHDLAQDALPTHIKLRPLGSIALADLERPEPVYQVQHIDLPGEFPPLIASARAGVKLPPLTPDFLGRDSLVEEVAGELIGGDTRLVTLTGPGGVGKTQLALAVALSLRDEFPGGVFFVALADVSTSAAALYALAAAVEVRESNAEELLDTVVRSISSAPVLLLLDNGEQVSGLDALVAELLSNVEQLAVITTSRSPLRLRAEHRVPVPPLGLPPRDDLDGLGPNEARGYPSLDLFVRRAQAVDPSFQLDDESLPSVLEICHRLEGSPLSLELAAARTDILSLHDIEQRLSTQLTLLTSSHVDIPERQRTARATIEWSVSLLAPSERAALFTLCLLVGPFTLSDATALCPGQDSAVTMGALVDSSLVHTSRTSTGRFFDVAEAVRQYGRTALEESGNVDAERVRSLRHLTDVVTTWAPKLDTSEATTAVTQIRRRYEDIRGAIEWTHRRGSASDAGPLLAALRRYWVYDGQLREPSVWLVRWLDAATPDDHCRADIELAAGVLAYLLGDTPAATTLLEQCLLRDQVGSATLARGYLGAVSLGEGDVERASAMAAECERLATTANDYTAESLALSLRAVIAAVAGDTPLEKARYLRRLALARDVGDERRTAETLNNLAEVALAEGDISSASLFAQEALTTARQSGRMVTRDALYTQARLDLMREDALSALVHARESLQLSLDLGQPFETSQAVTLIGAIAVDLGRTGEGAELMAAGQRMRSASGPPLDVDLEPELEEYRRRVATELGVPDFEDAAGRGATISMESAAQLAMGILPTR